jgi:hypothetical protein
MTRQLGRSEGAEIAEAAMVLPLVFMFLLGIVWFGRAFNIYSTITQAAQQGALAAARPTCASCGNAYANAGVQNAVEAVLSSSSLDPSQIMVNPNPAAPVFCPSPPNTCVNTGTSAHIKVCRNVLLNPPADPAVLPQCGTIVSFDYPFQFFLPFTSLNMQQVVMSTQAQTRMEN